MTKSKSDSGIYRLATRATLAYSQLHQVAYAQIAPDLTIVQTSSNFQSILAERYVQVEGRRLPDILVEFVGTEDVLHLVLHGAMPTFQLEMIRRDQPNGSNRYLTFHILPLDEFKIGTGLIFIAEDVTRFGQLGQKLVQRRNEVRLMQDALARAYAELERLALSDRKSADDALQIAHLELQDAYDRTMEGWVRALDLRDRETEGHTRRVAEVTIRVARAMGIPEAEIIHIRRGALLHDIGKMGVPDAILLKNSDLTEAEWAIMRKHPNYAYEMLSPITYLHPAVDIPYCHHEKWDGSGYPRGLKGEQIPLAARLFAVVDVWDALRSIRSYRRGWPEAKVLEHIRANAGTHFDPKSVEVFFRVAKEMVQEPDMN
jgi:putative nucleotidyltransferase with HDIG domain